MECYRIIFTLLITMFAFYVENSFEGPLSSQCPEVTIPNGRARLRARRRMIRYNCFPGYVMVGNKYAACIGGHWDLAPPVCVSSKCSEITVPENMVVAKKYNGGVLLFNCHPGYELQGPAEIYCDGRKWNDTVPTCKTTQRVTPLSCDFEKPDLCMWEQDPLHDFDWRRHNFDTPSWKIGTGPSHDHTLGPGYDGYYLYIEATDKPENATARIISPLYSSNLTEAGCFSFWYHMYGTTIGTLNIYFKAEGSADKKLMFSESGNQGNTWWRGFFSLPREENNFQLIIEGIRGSGYVSDIAVDDVAILQGNECLPVLNSTSTEAAVNDYNDQVEIVDGMQTCRERCNETTTTNKPDSLCQCDQECFINRNCCPDFLAYCEIMADYGTDLTVIFTETTIPTTIEQKRFSTGPDRIPIPINPKDGIDPYPSKFPPIIKPTSTSMPSTIAATPVTTNSRNGVTPRRKSTDNNDNFNNDTHIPTEGNAEKINHGRVKVTMLGIIAIVIGSLVGIGVTGLMIQLFLQKRNSYKKNSGSSALSDDSDVRFLTSDEMLDFNIARPEDMEM